MANNLKVITGEIQNAIVRVWRIDGFIYLYPDSDIVASRLVIFSHSFMYFNNV